ncbi:unnamed protein product [Tilletia controversa]|nr:hypothetical protein CF328_g9040 [Tilletia controversa]CAD6969297.1 unnamed protein product [Tilletia controversa]
MKPNTIKAGFRRTGIWPYNPNEVLSKYPNPKYSGTSSHQATSSQPNVLSSPSQPEPPVTPRNVRSIRRSAHEIEKRYDLSPTLEKYIRGTVENAQTGSLAISALDQQTAAQVERNKRNERQRKVTQSGGVLYAREAREIAQEKLQQEEKEEAKREWVKTKKEIKKRKDEGWAKVFVEVRKVAAKEEVKRAEKRRRLE